MKHNMSTLGKQHRYDLIVVTMEPFPYGLAATNRMLSYLKGIAQDHSVLFLTYAGPSYGTMVNSEQCGNYDGIHFCHTGLTYRKTRPNFFVRMVTFAGRLLKLFYLLLFHYQAKSILIYSRDSQVIKTCRLISKLKGIKYYRDITETNGEKNTQKSELSLKKISACFDGILCISQGIWDYFDNITDSKKFLLPVLIDSERFSSTKITRQKFFFYCSGANLERDGLLDILHGFLKFHQKNKEYTLQIATAINTADAYHLQCREIIDSHKDSILYCGELPSSEIPSKMLEATALLLTPHHGYITRGFPTKLGEYLMSGTPTICSAIDDIRMVIPDNAAFWVLPNSPDEIAVRMKEIVENPVHAGDIGRNGRKMMTDNFTYKKYEKELLHFLNLE